jgi:hypothetical protein
VTRQNVYDDEAFFTGYQRLRSAEAGLNAAIKQPALRALLPDVAGTEVVDLGCGCPAAVAVRPAPAPTRWPPTWPTDPVPTATTCANTGSRR